MPSWTIWNSIVDAQLDNMEQYSRRSSFRVTDINEHEGEDLSRIVTNQIDDAKLQDMNLSNINARRGRCSAGDLWFRACSDKCYVFIFSLSDFVSVTAILR